MPRFERNEVHLCEALKPDGKDVCGPQSPSGGFERRYVLALGWPLTHEGQATPGSLRQHHNDCPQDQSRTDDSAQKDGPWDVALEISQKRTDGPDHDQ